MTTVTTTRLMPDPQRFPPGTLVSAYRASAWSGHDRSVAPTGAADVGPVAVAADGSLTFTGLTDQTTYFAWAAGSGPPVRFATRHDLVDDIAGGDVVVYNTTAAAWPPRPNVSSVVTWYGPLTTAGNPPDIRDGDVVVDTAAAASSGGSFEKAIGICRTYAAAELITSSQAVTADRMNYMRLKGAMAGSTGAGIAVAVTNAAAIMGIAVYANSGAGDAAVPGARKCTTGPVTGASFPASASLTKIPWLEGATDVVEGDWLGFVCNDAATARFYRNGTLLPATPAAAAKTLAQNTVINGTPPANAAGTFVSQAVWYGRVFQ